MIKNIGICAAKHPGYILLKHIFNSSPIKPEFVITSHDDVCRGGIKNLCDLNSVYSTSLNPNSEEFIKLIRDNNIEIIFLLWYPELINEDVIESVKIGIVNLHPSLLPYGRGMHPWYWSQVEGTPHGVTIHFIDKSIDGGDILFQKEIKTDITYTGERLYDISLNEAISLFKEHFLDIINLNFNRIKQNENYKTHYTKDLNTHSEIKLDQQYKAIDLINIMRARTFRDGDSSYFYLNDKKYEVRIDIKEVK